MQNDKITWICTDTDDNVAKVAANHASYLLSYSLYKFEANYDYINELMIDTMSNSMIY